ncbi:MAG: hypothetical protein AB8H79_07845 [Myxococcota bacterium]
MRMTLVLLPWLALAACAGSDGSSDDPNDPNPSDSTDGSDDTDVIPEVYNPVLINFDELSADIDVSTEYADSVTFSATDDSALYAWDYARYARSGSYTAYTARSGGGAGVSSDLTWTFTDPVRNLMFYSLGDQRSGVIASIDITYDGGQTATVDMITDGAAAEADLHDLSDYARVTEITIRDMVDPNTVNYDDISFEQLER